MAFITLSDQIFHFDGDDDKTLIITHENQQPANAENVSDEQGRIASLSWQERAFRLSAFCEGFLDPEWREKIGAKLTPKSASSRLEVYSAYFQQALGARLYVGFAAIDPLRGNNTYTFPPELTYLCVSAKHRGFGIGKLLLDTYEKVARYQAPNSSGFAVHIDVLNTNNARKFYARNDYRYIRAIDQITRPYTDEEAQILRDGKEVSGDASDFLAVVPMYKILKPPLFLGESKKTPSTSTFRAALQRGQGATVLI